MAFTQEELEQAIAVVIGAFGRFNSYELDDDNNLTANFKSNSGKMDRQVYIKFDRDENGDFTGDMEVSQSNYYPGDSAGWGLANMITDALNRPEHYEDMGYDDKRIYSDDIDDLDNSDDESINGAVIIAALAGIAALGILAYQGGKRAFFFLKDKYQNRKQSNDSNEVSEMEKDSSVEVLQMVSEVTNLLNTELGKDYEGEITQEHFEEVINKAREIDPRSPFFWVRENKDRFTPEMIEYVETVYNKEL